MKEPFDTIARGDQDALQRLLEESPHLASETNEQGVSALLFALYYRQPGLSSLLRTHRATLSLFEAAALGELGLLQSALAAHPNHVNRRTPDGFTALHLACFFGQLEAVQLLLEAGAEPNKTAANAMQVAPLHSAAANGDLALVTTLLQHGANPDAAQQGGWTALHSAAKHGNLPLVEALLQHGADPSLAAEDGSTALSFAREEGHKEIVALLQAK